MMKGQRMGRNNNRGDRAMNAMANLRKDIPGEGVERFPIRPTATNSYLG